MKPLHASTEGMQAMTFEAWSRDNNPDGLNARAAWNAALEEAAKSCDERFKVIDNDHSGDNEYFYLDELENAAKAIRALKNAAPQAPAVTGKAPPALTGTEQPAGVAPSTKAWSEMDGHERAAYNAGAEAACTPSATRQSDEDGKRFRFLAAGGGYHHGILTTVQVDEKTAIALTPMQNAYRGVCLKTAVDKAIKESGYAE